MADALIAALAIALGAAAYISDTRAARRHRNRR